MNAREVALQTVRDVFVAPGSGNERSAQEALDYRARKANLDSRDRAFATELAYGAIKMRRASSGGKKASGKASAGKSSQNLAEWLASQQKSGHRS